MKKSVLLLSFVLVAGAAYAEDAKKPEAPKAAAGEKAVAKADKVEAKAAAPKMTTHKVAGEVVSTDLDKATLTLKTDKGETTAPVEGVKAKAALKTVKAGDAVTVTCRDENGEHKAVTAIWKTKAPAPAAAPAKSSDKK